MQQKFTYDAHVAKMPGGTGWMVQDKSFQPLFSIVVADPKFSDALLHATAVAIAERLRQGVTVEVG